MIEKTGGDIIVGKAQQIGACGKRVVKCDQHILTVYKQRWKIVCRVIGQRDGKDGRREQRQQPVSRQPAANEPVAGNNHRQKQADQQQIGACKAEDHRHDDGRTPGKGQRIDADQVEPDKCLVEPVE